MVFLVAQRVKCLPAMKEPPGSILGLGRSPGEGNGNPDQYFCLENPMDRSLVGSGPGATKSQTQLSEYSTITTRSRATPCIFTRFQPALNSTSSEILSGHLSEWEKTFANHLSDKEKIATTHGNYNSATNTQETPTSQIKHGQRP